MKKLFCIITDRIRYREQHEAVFNDSISASVALTAGYLLSLTPGVLSPLRRLKKMASNSEFCMAFLALTGGLA